MYLHELPGLAMAVHPDWRLGLCFRQGLTAKRHADPMPISNWTEPPTATADSVWQLRTQDHTDGREHLAMYCTMWGRS